MKFKVGDKVKGTNRFPQLMSQTFEIEEILTDNDTWCYKCNPNIYGPIALAAHEIELDPIYANEQTLKSALGVKDE